MGDHTIRCTSIGVYEQALTRGNVYEVIAKDAGKYRIVGDHGRRVWIPQNYFSTDKGTILIMQSWCFDHDIETDCFVEVTLTFNDGSRRWCILTTPDKLVEHFTSNSIDPPGIHIRHLIIMKTLNWEDVENTLRHLDHQGELEALTIALNDEG